MYSDTAQYLYQEMSDKLRQELDSVVYQTEIWDNYPEIE